MTVSGAAWHTDPYVLAPGPKSLLTLFDAQHGLGGISGYDVAETTDENPERVDDAAWLTSAYLRMQLGMDRNAWQKAQRALTTAKTPLGRVDSK